MILLVTIWIQPRLSFARVSWYISSMNIFLLLSNKYVCIENYFNLFHLRKTHQLNIFLYYRMFPFTLKLISLLLRTFYYSFVREILDIIYRKSKFHQSFWLIDRS